MELTGFWIKKLFTVTERENKRVRGEKRREIPKKSKESRKKSSDHVSKFSVTLD